MKAIKETGILLFYEYNSLSNQFNSILFSHVQRDSIQYIKNYKHLYYKGGLKRIRINLFGLVWALPNGACCFRVGHCLRWKRKLFRWKRKLFGKVWKRKRACLANGWRWRTLNYFWFISKFFLYLVLNEEAEFDFLMLQSIVSHICDAANWKVCLP